MRRLTRSRDRDDEFAAFADRSLPVLLRGAFLLLRDAHAAEDAVQVTMLRVFRNWERARPAPDAYSRTTLVNVCRDHWRHQGRRPQQELTEHDQALADVVPFADRVAERDALARALTALPQRQREILVLRFYFDLSVEQSAELLQLSEGTVKSATHRGLESLRGLLDPMQAEASAC